MSVLLSSEMALVAMKQAETLVIKLLIAIVKTALPVSFMGLDMVTQSHNLAV